MSISPVSLIFWGFALLLGAMVFRVGQRANWHWAAALCIGLVPVVFVFLLGIFGLLISISFVAALYKATA